MFALLSLQVLSNTFCITGITIARHIRSLKITVASSS